MKVPTKPKGKLQVGMQFMTKDEKSAIQEFAIKGKCWIQDRQV